MRAVLRSASSVLALLLLGACSSTVDVFGDGGSGGGGADAAGGSGGTGNGGPSGTGTGSGAGGPSSTSTGSGASGPGGSGSTGTGAVICGSSSPCTECVANACPEVWCECTDDIHCGGLFLCLDECAGDEACVQACLSAHPDGISDVVLVADCAKVQCPAECPEGQGDDLSPCEVCLYSSCDAEMNACLSTPACLGLWQCLNGCPQLDLSCQQGCYDGYGDGVPPLEAVLDCAVTDCPMVCEG